MLNVLQMKKDLIAYLLSDGEIIDAEVNKIYQSIADKNAAHPYVVYHEVGGSEEETYEGPCMGVSRIQFDFCSASTVQCEEIANAFYSRLTSPNRFSNGSTHFQHVKREDGGITSYEQSNESGGFGEYRKTVDYSISYTPLNQNN